MEVLVLCLICVPFLMALMLACVKNDKARAAMVYLFGLVIAAAAVTTAVMWGIDGVPTTFDLPGREIFDKVILAGDFLLMFVVIFLSFKYKKGIISLLSIVQTLLVAGVELFGPEVFETASTRIDWLSDIMIAIIGVVGVAIGIYAIGYMRGYHVHHSDVNDRRPFFFAIVFAFYGAMFGLVTSTSLVWIYFFWEITSVCSFLLIGYTKTTEAINNSFKALWMNLLGGFGIAIAIAYAAYQVGSFDLYVVVEAGKVGMLVPIAMLAFAAFTKSAQFPFSGWLLGAMVAPTPSSALLHSATMVKAGVYMLIRISPAMSGNEVGQMVYLVGGFTFFAASLLAIAQSDGKKVLAYSTISNLGLIVACAGDGSKETLWAAVFLVIFHAVSKSMLFQCVGAIENATGSRDIEDMEGLSLRFPKLAFILMVGIAGMFLAPFGMLISKWAALKSFVDSGSVVMILFIVYGSSSTMFYWTKWFTKILGTNEKKEKDVTQVNEYISMFIHSFLLIALCVAFPFLANYMIGPMMKDMFGASTQVLSEGNIIIMIVMVVAIFIVPVINYVLSRRIKETNVIAYMGGANAGDNIHFVDSMGEPKELKASNWYMTNWFGEDKIFKPSIAAGTLIILVFLGVVIGGAF